jgi:hypothetical protein
MNTLIRKTNRSIIFALATLSLATAVPLFFVKWPIVSAKKVMFILAVALDELSISLFGLMMIFFSMTVKWKSVDYDTDTMARAEAKARHDFAYMLIIVGIIFFIFELVFL